MSYGYVGVGLCHRCANPEFLFVISDSDYGAEQVPRCRDCHSYYRETPIPTVPIMDETPLCQSCNRPEFIQERSDSDQNYNRWVFIPAYLADGQTEITVHTDCSTLSRRFQNCVDCETVYATTRNRDWRLLSPITNSQFITFTQIEGENRCDSCTSNFYQENGGEHNYISCPSCEDIFHRDNGQWYDDSLYCEGCHDSNVYDCNECGETQWDGNGHDCSEEEDNGSIHSYSYRPSPYFFGEGQYHLGFELEVEARNTSRHEGASLVEGILGSHAYMKDDGSLSDGFEIVTHPHTLSKYQTDFNWDFIPKLKREGFRSWNTDTCGLHVHVSRTAFGEGGIKWNTPDNQRDQLIMRRQAHELRFMKLIYDNQRQVERIAGRSGNHYATFQDKGKLVSKLKFGNQSNGRYSAINSENDATLEVRVFKGSLRKERVLSALEFVTASVEYTRDLKVTAKNQALTWLAFTGYVSTHLDTYPNLALIMSESFASDTNPDEN
jgi:hypothetical protein